MEKDKEALTSEQEKAQKTKEDFEIFVSEFRNESDRAAVILGASKIDSLLSMMLDKFLLPCPNSTDNLLSNNGPLATFSSKIDMCYRLGLIDSHFCRNIHLVRRIRNSFAHEVYGAKLNSGSHRDRVKSLASSLNHHPWFNFLRDNYFQHDVEDVRADFSSSLGIMIVRLDVALRGIQPISNADMEPLLPQQESSKENS